MPCHSFMIWTGTTTRHMYYLRDFTSCMEFYFLIDCTLSRKHRQAYMSTGCVHACSCLHNLQQGGMIMLHELFQKHEAFACDMFPDEKKQPGYFWPFYATSGITYFLPCHFWPWHKAAKSG